MVAIHVSNLGKYFHESLGRDGSSAEDALRVLLQIVGVNRQPSSKDGIRRVEHPAGWALRDISLDIEAGSVVCLVGASGSGKTLLLKILSGAMPPTIGRIEIRGWRSSLLSIGEYLDARLTAWENIDHYRRMMGFQKKTEANVLQRVISFAELEGFEHMPVRTYSTGMTMRLSLALALHGSPSILLMDDVLGVGDIGFQRKVVERLHELKSEGCTMVLALSDSALVRQLASRVIRLANGRIIGEEVPGNIVHKRVEGLEWEVTSSLPENDIMALRSVYVDVQEGSPNSSVRLTLAFDVKTMLRIWYRPFIDVTHGKLVLLRSLFPGSLCSDHSGIQILTVDVPLHFFAEGQNKITIGAVIQSHEAVYSMKAFDAVRVFLQREQDSNGSPACSPLLWISLPWEIEAISSCGVPE